MAQSGFNGHAFADVYPVLHNSFCFAFAALHEVCALTSE